MSDDELHTLAGAYAVDAVDGVERARFEQHLAGCAECREEVASLRLAAAELGELVVAGPPAYLRDAVLSGISSVRPLPLPSTPAPAGPPVGRHPVRPEQEADPHARVHRLADRRRRRTRAWAAGLVAAAGLGVVGLVWQPWRTELSPTDRVLQAQDARRYPTTVQDGVATIVRSASLGRAVLVAEKLPALPADKVYELWLQRADGTFAPAGLVPKTGADEVVQPLTGDARTALGAGITVEPAGGSPQPTTKPIVLVSFA
ncbi:MAG TPA: anti-sigma factor [Dermatophilaceae bacterium]|nr:anti-sigma factor [Dermatophilaceae bacterium]